MKRIPSGVISSWLIYVSLSERRRLIRDALLYFLFDASKAPCSGSGFRLRPPAGVKSVVFGQAKRREALCTKGFRGRGSNLRFKRLFLEWSILDTFYFRLFSEFCCFRPHFSFSGTPPTARQRNPPVYLSDLVNYSPPIEAGLQLPEN